MKEIYLIGVIEVRRGEGRERKRERREEKCNKAGKESID